MKKILTIIILLSFFSCKRDILDIPPQDRIAEDAVWTDESLIKAYHTGLYNGIPHGFYLHMFSKYTDEAYGGSAPCCGANIMARGTYNADNITEVASGDFWGGYMYYWDRGYQFIRKVNVFLEKMEGDQINFDSKDLLVAEAKFLRAFMYFELIKRHGGVPIVTQSYELGDSATFKRNTFDECVAFIEKDLGEAMPVLPGRYASTDANFGRATQDASKALLSRVLLYAASPLFNPTNDQQKWQKAADAAEALLSSDYSLNPDYGKTFNQASGAPNTELIFTRNFTTSNGHQAPMHNLSRRYGAYGGWWASNGPTQNLVDDYDMTNGEPAFIYVNGVKTVNTASGYNPQNPYANRDPRLDATVIHDGTVYRGDLFEMWVSTDGATWGFDSYKQSGDNPRTGYVLKKFMPEADVPLNWQTTYTIPWIHFRLAEIYLNYAEAKFELGDEATCREYISKVRARVNMPAIPATVTGEALRRRLYNERRIELAFEGHRFFDIRRWKIAKDVENRPVIGMDITRNQVTQVKTYTPVQLLVKATYEDKMNLLPIATSEIRRNKELEQSPGW
jgi:starch-binding outer membrane protein, SusD/RagB family